LLIELMLYAKLVLSHPLFVQLGGLGFEVTHGACVGAFPFFDRSLLLAQEMRNRHELVNPLVTFGESAL
jgi:hypothetical protein